LLQLDRSNFCLRSLEVPRQPKKVPQRERKWLTREGRVGKLARFPKATTVWGAAQKNLAARKKVVDRKSERG